MIEGDYIPAAGDRVSYERAAGGKGKGLITLIMSLSYPEPRTEVDVQDEDAGVLVVLDPAVDTITKL